MDRPWRCAVWPPRSPDLYPADYQVWGCRKTMAYARKVHTTELPWRNLTAARFSNKDSVATLVRRCTKQMAASLNTLRTSRTTQLYLCIKERNSINTEQFTDSQPLSKRPLCIRYFWRRITSGIKSCSSGLKSWDTLYTLPATIFYHHEMDKALSIENKFGFGKQSNRVKISGEKRTGDNTHAAFDLTVLHRRECVRTSVRHRNQPLVQDSSHNVLQVPHTM